MQSKILTSTFDCVTGVGDELALLLLLLPEFTIISVGDSFVFAAVTAAAAAFTAFG